MMWARVKLDIGWRDLAYALGACLAGGDERRRQRDLEALWSPDADAIACISVRSGFDLLLQALLAEGRIAPGDEVLFSALNIKQMIRIAERLDLTPVPVDLDLAEMAPRLDAARRAASDRSRVFVVAHLFGAEIDMTPIAAFARERGLFLVEDCAQAYRGLGYRGSGRADASLFSFGPIKTKTCLGGALLTVAAPKLLARMRAMQAEYPAMPAKAFAKRALKYALLKFLTGPRVFGLVVRYLGWRGVDYDARISDGVRDVARQKTPSQLRRRPGAALLRLMARRLRQDVGPALAERMRLGQALAGTAGAAADMPAGGAAYHDYWVFPVLVDDPQACLEALRAAGFDASGLPRSEAVAPPPGRHDLDPLVAADTIRRLIVLPCYPGMPIGEVRREAEVFKSAVAPMD